MIRPINVSDRSFLQSFDVGATGKTIRKPWQQAVLDILLWGGDISLIEARIEHELTADADLNGRFAKTVEMMWNSSSSSNPESHFVHHAPDPGSFASSLLPGFHLVTWQRIEEWYHLPPIAVHDWDSVFNTTEQVRILSEILEQELKGKTAIETIKKMAISFKGTM